MAVGYGYREHHMRDLSRRGFHKLVADRNAEIQARAQQGR